MNIDLVLIAGAAFFLLILIIWLMIKNRADRKNWEKEEIQAEIKPEKHQDPKI